MIKEDKVVWYLFLCTYLRWQVLDFGCGVLLGFLGFDGTGF
jgi:hypothetical protein